MFTIDDVVSLKEVFWKNPNYNPARVDYLSLGLKDVQAAEARWLRFAPYLAKVFPETASLHGLIESPLVPIPHMQQYLADRYQQNLPGQLWLKCDHQLPIAGSVKARGGVYEVLKHAEDLALQHNLLTPDNDYSILASDQFKNFFSQYAIGVGSTGNLGLSIGIISAKLGFQVTVHMSADAKPWKKELLKSHGVKVIEYRTDYSAAVTAGRKQAELQPNCYFIDDENSPHLFLGYAVAANRLKQQLTELNIVVDQEHPLFVYLPCGVGGAPGGITFGLKLIYRELVHCFLAEPTHAPCMLLGLSTGLHDQVSVQEFGLDNITEADGLAVGRPSKFVGKLIEPLVSGIYTVPDDDLFKLLQGLVDTEQVPLEPSALAGMPGPLRLLTSPEGLAYIAQNHLSHTLKQGTHIIWATGGSMVPEQIMREYYRKGQQL